MAKQAQGHGKPSAAHPASTYSTSEEIWSAAIHAVGIVLGLAGLAILVTLSALYGDAWSTVGVSIFGTSVVMMYLFSTLYHAVPQPKAKAFLKKLDHIAIFYLITGTYTPFLLDTLRSAGAWVAFGILWGLTLVGTALKLFARPDGMRWWSIGLYMGMGWAAVFLIEKFVRALPTAGLVFLAAGGLCYTIGVVFYVQKKRPYMHAIWHVFVLAGTILHFFAVLYSCVLN